MCLRELSTPVPSASWPINGNCYPRLTAGGFRTDIPSVQPYRFLHRGMNGGDPVDPLYRVSQVLDLPLLSVVDDDLLNLRPELPDEPDYLIVVAVPAEPLNPLDLAPDVDDLDLPVIPHQARLTRPVQDPPPECTLHLVRDEDHLVLIVRGYAPEVLQDGTPLEHPRGRHDDRGALPQRLLPIGRVLDRGEVLREEGVRPFVEHHRPQLSREVVGVGDVNRRRLRNHPLDEYRSLDERFVLHVSVDDEEYLLCASNRGDRDEHLSALLKGPVYRVHEVHLHLLPQRHDVFLRAVGALRDESLDPRIVPGGGVEEEGP